MEIIGIEKWKVIDCDRKTEMIGIERWKGFG